MLTDDRKANDNDRKRDRTHPLSSSQTAYVQQRAATPRAATHIYKELLEDIISLRRKPMEPISEKDIAAHFGVSRTPVHQAVLRLADDGLIDIFPQSGTFVARIPRRALYEAILIRKSLENHPDLVNEDFTYLFRMMDYDSLTKMQLIEKNAHEKQTGIEIIKRLVKNGLLAESPDENDKRSTRIAVTPKGKKVFLESIQDITVVSKIMCGQLNTKEKESLLSSLKKLNTFHHIVYSNFKNENTSEILKLI